VLYRYATQSVWGDHRFSGQRAKHALNSEFRRRGKKAQKETPAGFEPAVCPVGQKSKLRVITTRPCCLVVGSNTGCRKHRKNGVAVSKRIWRGPKCRGSFCERKRSAKKWGTSLQKIRKTFDF